MTDDYVAPTEEYGTPIPPMEEEKGSNNKLWIIILVVVLILCCCCILFSIITYQFLGDLLLEAFGLLLMPAMWLP